MAIVNRQWWGNRWRVEVKSLFASGWRLKGSSLRTAAFKKPWVAKACTNLGHTVTQESISFTYVLSVNCGMTDKSLEYLNIMFFGMPIAWISIKSVRRNCDSIEYVPVDRVLGVAEMAQIHIEINRKVHSLLCADGEEERLESVAQTVIEKANELSDRVGNVHQTQLLLMVAMLLADEIHEYKDRWYKWVPAKAGSGNAAASNSNQPCTDADNRLTASAS